MKKLKLKARFRTPFDQYAKYHGKPFKLVNPDPINTREQARLGEAYSPLYAIEFADGVRIGAFGEEIRADMRFIPSAGVNATRSPAERQRVSYGPYHKAPWGNPKQKGA